MPVSRLVCLLACLLLTWPAQAQLPVDTLLTIGDEESAGAEYLFGQISGFARADDGRMFVSDVVTSDVRVYDASGEFVTHLGTRGEGPGEFERPRVFRLTTAGLLYVFDERHHRVTVFNTESYEVEDILPFGFWRETPQALDEDDWGGKLQLYEGPDNSHVLLTYSGIPPASDAEKENRPLLTHVGADLSQVLQRFGSIPLVDGNDNFQKTHASLSPGNVAVQEQTTLWFAPGPYTGALFTFTYEDDGWGDARVVRGMEVRGEVFETLPADTQLESGHPYVVVQDASGPTSIGRRLRGSVGLVEATDGTIYHFVQHINTDAERGELTVERFSAAGQLTGVYSLLSGLPSSSEPVLVEAMDEDGNLYILDRTGDAPVIRVLSVEWPE